MNNRIRELVEQAILDADIVYEDNILNEELAKMYIPDCFAEQFANLIIKECIQRIEVTSAPLIENMDSAQNYGYAQWWEGYDDRGVDSIECIKKHFGIE